MTTDETVSPAQELRAAASKIRGFAGIAPKGPWCAYPGSVATDWHPNSADWRRGQRDEDVASNTGSASEHIALWHPGVAEAVADWLEQVAEIEEHGFRPATSSALAVARAINGTGA